MVLNFPASPSLNDEYIGDNNVIYKWDGYKWVSAEGVVPERIVKGDTKAQVFDTGSDGTFKVFTDNTEQFNISPSGDVVLLDQNELRFSDSGNASYVGFKAPAAASGIVWTLPATDGSVDQSLTTNGNGILSWADGGSTANNGQLTVEGVSGITGSGIFTADQAANTTISLQHADTSSQASVNNSNGTVIQDVTLDDYGHVTGLASVDLDSRYLASNTNITVNTVTADLYQSKYSGSDSGYSRGSYPYAFGFQEGGAWTNPYPDLVLQYHTGIAMAANPGYNGITFYNDYNDSTVRFRINGGGSYSYKYTWMYTNTNGFYSDTNNWHIEPNTLTSYGSMNMRGNRNGWYGISWHEPSYDPHIMFDNNGGGLYAEGLGRWLIYHSYGNNSLGINSSATSSSYALYVSGSIYATGNIVAYSDKRKKTNISTIENSLDKVLSLRGVTYNKLDMYGEPEAPLKMGVIAQEVEKVIPEVVTYAEDVDEYGVEYGNMAGLFIEAIKEQNAMINELKQEIAELKRSLSN